jgi:hypothetical protein
MLIIYCKGLTKATATFAIGKIKIHRAIKNNQYAAEKP